MDLPGARHLAQTLMAQHGLFATQPPWSFAFNRRRRALGICHFDDRRIELSSFFVVANSQAAVRDTLLHEIAHALAGPAAGHGPQWKNICIKIGAKPQRLDTQAAMPRGAWRATCQGCGHQHHRHRRPVARGEYFCRSCGAERGRLQFARFTTNGP